MRSYIERLVPKGLKDLIRGLLPDDSDDPLNELDKEESDLSLLPRNGLVVEEAQLLSELLVVLEELLQQKTLSFELDPTLFVRLEERVELLFLVEEELFLKALEHLTLLEMPFLPELPEDDSKQEDDVIFLSFLEDGSS